MSVSLSDRDAMLAQTLTCLSALLSALTAIIASSPLVTPAVAVIAIAFGRVVHSTPRIKPARQLLGRLLPGCRCAFACRVAADASA